MQWLGSLLFTTYLFGFDAVLCRVRPGGFVVAGRSSSMAWRSFWARNQLWVLREAVRADLHGRRAWRTFPAGNHISMWKHSSAWETIAQMVIFPPQSWVLKRELMWIPGRRLGDALHASDRDQPQGGRFSGESGRCRRASGGWRGPVDPHLSRGNTDAAGRNPSLRSQRCAAGAHGQGGLWFRLRTTPAYFWQRRGLLKRAGVIRVVIGPPIATEGRDPRSINEEAQAWIEVHGRAPQARVFGRACATASVLSS